MVTASSNNCASFTPQVFFAENMLVKCQAAHKQFMRKVRGCMHGFPLVLLLVCM